MARTCCGADLVRSALPRSAIEVPSYIPTADLTRSAPRTTRLHGRQGPRPETRVLWTYSPNTAMNSARIIAVAPQTCTPSTSKYGTFITS